MTSYVGNVNGTSAYHIDNSFVGPVTVPSNFTGFHNNSIGTGSATTIPALVSATLNPNKTLNITVTRGGNGYYQSTNSQNCALVFSGGDYLTTQGACRSNNK